MPAKHSLEFIDNFLNDRNHNDSKGNNSTIPTPQKDKYNKTSTPKRKFIQLKDFGPPATVISTLLLIGSFIFSAGYWVGQWDEKEESRKLEQQITDLKDDKASLTNDKISLTKKVSLLQTHSSYLKNSLNDRTEKLLVIQKRIGRMDTRISELHEEMEDINRTISKISNIGEEVRMDY